MDIFLYDNTFEGFLSTVFHRYETKIEPSAILGNRTYQSNIFAKKHKIDTVEPHAKRVWQGIEKKTNKELCQKIYRVFLSGEPNVELLLMEFIKKCFSTGGKVDEDLTDPTVLAFNKINRKVTFEAHRAIMFIRFQKTSDGTYFAPFDPQYNVLPLCIKHFKDRFSDQKWVIYDTRRNYGYFFDLEQVSEIKIKNSQVHPISGSIDRESLDSSELDFQALWNDYFQSINIVERKNPKVHKQFLPKRFWKYLPEKNFVVVKRNQ